MSELRQARRGKILQSLRNGHRVELPVLRHGGETRGARVPRVRRVPNGAGGAKDIESANHCAVGCPRRRDARAGRCTGVVVGSGRSRAGTAAEFTAI